MSRENSQSQENIFLVLLGKTGNPFSWVKIADFYPTGKGATASQARLIDRDYEQASQEINQAAAEMRRFVDKERPALTAKKRRQLYLRFLLNLGLALIAGLVGLKTFYLVEEAALPIGSRLLALSVILCLALFLLLFARHLYRLLRRADHKRQNQRLLQEVEALIAETADWQQLLEYCYHQIRYALRSGVDPQLCCFRPQFISRQWWELHNRYRPEAGEPTGLAHPSRSLLLLTAAATALSWLLTH